LQATLAHFVTSQQQMQASAPYADAIVASPEGRRQATGSFATNYEHIPPELIAHRMHGVAGCVGATPMIELALREGYALEAENVTCPVRIVWGTADELPFGVHRPGAARPVGECRSWRYTAQREKPVAHFSLAKRPRVYSAAIPPRPGPGAAS
jgi:hypothetical protein